MNKTLIEKLIDLNRGILSHFAQKDNDKYDSFREGIKEIYGFEKQFGWNILLNAVYVIQDTELAKQSFMKFQLQGPSRHDDIGEKYLRLYGLLKCYILTADCSYQFVRDIQAAAPEGNPRQFRKTKYCSAAK